MSLRLRFFRWLIFVGRWQPRDLSRKATTMRRKKRAAAMLAAVAVRLCGCKWHRLQQGCGCNKRKTGQRCARLLWRGAAAGFGAVMVEGEVRERWFQIWKRWQRRFDRIRRSSLQRMLPCISGIVIEETAVSQRKFRPKIVNFGAVVLGDEDEEKRVPKLEKMAANLIKFQRKIAAVYAVLPNRIPVEEAAVSRH
ncbi:hypothetical protein B296_00050851 [Ensete ventricosum]|uniref:Uncharacterized protein n=1 Tax=Ensete ventricosum TaxID=4639 RepID=A0A426X2V8_ENSVE|nr:hypothetical protein B296_00050851 [Ensete ventricosum]